MVNQARGPSADQVGARPLAVIPRVLQVGGDGRLRGASKRNSRSTQPRATLARQKVHAIGEKEEQHSFFLIATIGVEMPLAPGLKEE